MMDTVSLFFGDSSFSTELDVLYSTVQLALNDNFIDQKIKNIAEKAGNNIIEFISQGTEENIKEVDENLIDMVVEEGPKFEIQKEGQGEDRDLREKIYILFAKRKGIAILPDDIVSGILKSKLSIGHKEDFLQINEFGQREPMKILPQYARYFKPENSPALKALFQLTTYSINSISAQAYTEATMKELNLGKRIRDHFKNVTPHEIKMYRDFILGRFASPDANEFLMKIYKRMGLDYELEI